VKLKKHHFLPIKKKKMKETISMRILKADKEELMKKN